MVNIYFCRLSPLAVGLKSLITSLAQALRTARMSYAPFILCRRTMMKDPEEQVRQWLVFQLRGDWHILHNVFPSIS